MIVILLFSIYLRYFKKANNYIMIQNYQNDPLLHNYLAPSYPIFIQIKYLINGLAAKKSIKNAKQDILYVISQ